MNDLHTRDKKAAKYQGSATVGRIKNFWKIIDYKK